MHVPAGTTLTGIRIPSSWWRTRLSTEWDGFATGATGRVTGTKYTLDTRPESWTYNNWIHTEQGAVDAGLEDVISRLNPETKDWGFSYRSVPSDRRVQLTQWLPECNATGKLFMDAGWINQLGEMTDNLRWGWGITTLMRDWESSNLIVLNVPRYTVIIYEATTYSPHTWLSRGASEQEAGPGLLRDYIGRQPTSTPDETWGRKEPIEQGS